MTVTIAPEISLTPIETITSDAAAEINITHNLFDQQMARLTGTTSPPVSMVSYQTFALVAGTKTIDLTAVLNYADVAQDATGLKVQTLIFINPAGNATMNIAPGGANPYPLFGTGNDVDVPAHATIDNWIAFSLLEGLPDVSGTVKNITITGTGTQSFKIGIVLG